MSTRWNRPMRRFVAAVLVCAKCDKRITGETRMVDGQLFHVLCAPKAAA